VTIVGVTKDASTSNFGNNMAEDGWRGVPLCALHAAAAAAAGRTKNNLRLIIVEEFSCRPSCIVRYRHSGFSS